MAFPGLFFLFIFITWIPAADLKSPSLMQPMGTAPACPEFSVDHGTVAPFSLEISSNEQNKDLLQDEALRSNNENYIRNLFDR
jgi:hypothetical protein